MEVFFSQRDKSKDEGMLLADFVDEHNFASCVSERVEENGSRNSDKKEHIEQDKSYDKCITPLGPTNHWQLIVRVRVIRRVDICYVDTFDKIAIVLLVIIDFGVR